MNWQVENRTESGRNSKHSVMSSSQPALATTAQDQPKVLNTIFLIVAMDDAAASFFSNYCPFFNQVGCNQGSGTPRKSLAPKVTYIIFLFNEIGTNMVHKLLDEEEM